MEGLSQNDGVQKPYVRQRMRKARPLRPVTRRVTVVLRIGLRSHLGARRAWPRRFLTLAAANTFGSQTKQGLVASTSFYSMT